eukprot:SM000026S08887  [mRNA]  locus=s26:222141:222776:- [translate_table: standard]
MGFARIEPAPDGNARPVARAAADEPPPPPSPSPPSLPPSAQPATGSTSSKRVAAKDEKGQATAIVTGVIAVLLGVAYLVLVQLLDTRGINLVPPPPEAFDP